MTMLDGQPRIISPICSLCRHLRDVVDRQCDAFPDGIPLDIWEGRNDHRAPVDGDNGIRFAFAPGVAPAVRERWLRGHA